mgnify:CR=1 FL=1
MALFTIPLKTFSWFLIIIWAGEPGIARFLLHFSSSLKFIEFKRPVVIHLLIWCFLAHAATRRGAMELGSVRPSVRTSVRVFIRDLSCVCSTTFNFHPRVFIFAQEVHLTNISDKFEAQRFWKNCHLLQFLPYSVKAWLRLIWGCVCSSTFNFHPRVFIFTQEVHHTNILVKFETQRIWQNFSLKFSPWSVKLDLGWHGVVYALA